MLAVPVDQTAVFSEFANQSFRIPSSEADDEWIPNPLSRSGSNVFVFILRQAGGIRPGIPYEGFVLQPFQVANCVGSVTRKCATIAVMLSFPPR